MIVSGRRQILGRLVGQLVGSGDKVMLTALPFLVLGGVLNLFFPSVFAVGGPPFVLQVIATALLAVGLVVWAWSAFLILVRVPRGELITGGPFAVVKHPLYTGVALLVLPFGGILLNTWLGIVVGAALYVGTRRFAPEEERELAGAFGERWNTYTRAVLLPWV